MHKMIECLILCILVFSIGVVLTIGILQHPEKKSPEKKTEPKAHVQQTPVRKVYNTRLRERMKKKDAEKESETKKTPVKELNL